MHTITNRNEPCQRTFDGSGHVWSLENVSADESVRIDRCIYCQGLFHRCETDRPAWAADPISQFNAAERHQLLDDLADDGYDLDAVLSRLSQIEQRLDVKLLDHTPKRMNVNRQLHWASVEELHGLPHDELVALVLQARYELSI